MARSSLCEELNSDIVCNGLVFLILVVMLSRRCNKSESDSRPSRFADGCDEKGASCVLR